MSTNIVVPELGESVVEARVARWLKKEGEAVSVGEPLVELETEKVDLEVGASLAGVLVRIVRGEGEDVKIGELLGVVDENAAATVPSPATTARAAATVPQQATPSPAPVAVTPPPAEPAPGAERADRMRTTPAARRVAEAHEVDLAAVQGSGAGGRVMRHDVESHVRTPGEPVAAATAPAAPARAERPAPPAVAPVPAGDRREERVRMSKRRLTIARRLVEAQHNAAMLTTFNEIDMSAVQDLRRRHKESFRTRHGVGLGLTSFFVNAAIAALKALPRLNAEIDGDVMVLKHYHDIGIAVGAPGGLVVPVLRDADRLSFAAIEQAVKDFARRAGDGTLTIEDLRGGTFTITNGGIFGSLLSTPILNPPQVGILGLHKIEDRAVPVNGQVVIRPMMYAALSYDHRIVDGREAVQFLVRVKEIVEDPASLMFES